MADAAGVLYGTSIAGGASDAGTVFSLAPPISQGGPWVETTLHTFTGTAYAPSSDGANPTGTLAIDSEGVLYGTTEYGGSYGYGTAFSLTPPASPGEPWKETIRHSFGNGSDGADPLAGLAIAGHGLLYGTTYGGGTSNLGTVFSLSRPAAPGGSWGETVLYSFRGDTQGFTDGEYPEYGALVTGKGGVLYGITYAGGSSGVGTVFSLAPPSAPGGAWTENVLYSFSFRHGQSPYGGLALGKGGILYGTTSEGGAGARNDAGTVFQLTPPKSQGQPWKYTNLFVFTDSNPNGQAPRAGVTLGKGVLYGTTSGQGLYANPSPGTVFQVTL